MSLFAGAWAQLGAVGVVIFLVILVVTGRLVPKSVLAREVDSERRRADQLERALQVADQRADRQAEQIGELLILARAADSLQRAVLARPPDRDPV